MPWLLHLVPGGFGCLASLVLGLVNSLGDARARRRPTVSVRVRQCAECGPEGRPPAIAPDYDTRRISFDAHPRFVEALARVGRDAAAARKARTGPPRGDDGARPLNPS